MQPVELEDYGGSLRAEVKEQIPAAMEHALSYLARFGIEAKRRAEPLPDTATIACERMVMSRYEAERPDEEVACRFGDARFLETLSSRAKEKAPD